ncbi:MAG: hypothetical protein V4625_02375 [Pseudomonadota bacterium]
MDSVLLSCFYIALVSLVIGAYRLRSKKAVPAEKQNDIELYVVLLLAVVIVIFGLWKS